MLLSELNCRTPQPSVKCADVKLGLTEGFAALHLSISFSLGTKRKQLNISSSRLQSDIIRLYRGYRIDPGDILHGNQCRPNPDYLDKSRCIDISIGHSVCVSLSRHLDLSRRQSMFMRLLSTLLSLMLSNFAAVVGQYQGWSQLPPLLKCRKQNARDFFPSRLYSLSACFPTIYIEVGLSDGSEGSEPSGKRDIKLEDCPRSERRIKCLFGYHLMSMMIRYNISVRPVMAGWAC